MLNVEALSVFVAVADGGSFSAAAERLGQTTSGVSRTITRLETQLGVALLTRTTRRLDLTAEGEWLLERARRTLADLQDTEEQMATLLSQPAGPLRINASTPALTHMIAPLLPAFLEAYPLVRPELTAAESVVDLIEERADVAVRIGPLADSTLNARRLGTSQARILASPDYLAQLGTPRSTADLTDGAHRLLGFSQPESLNLWPLRHEGGEGLKVTPHVTSSSGQALLHLALAGAGIVRLADFLTRTEVRAGRLVEVLPAARLPWGEPVWAVFYKQGALPPRVAVFVRFYAEQLQRSGVLDP
ncbi:LysR family transcriptional regulator [Massilia arenosa]|uniref:LysR family transcriptional regulator n=1 Tax=Zemynaea arenosa TaxID=2561931 RepID=A0A4Y9SUA8_9BURK|nr:LysR family transcriptional regulator [Massilia arenosa]TFW30211.1 LysR family transcriptional regulator [Massilia arenosa]